MNLTNASRGAATSPSAATVGGADVRIWGMTPEARLARTFQRLDLPQIDLARTDAAQASADAELVVAHAGWVFDESLIRSLAARPQTVLVDDAGRPVAAHVTSAEASQAVTMLESGQGGDSAWPRVTAVELAGAYNSALRKREPPVLVKLTAETRGPVEKRLFQGSYKGVTDLVTKYVWPAPARVVTRWCALAGITPNQVTFASFLLVLVAMWLFWTGQFGWGLAAAWVMTFLDTVDGKLARVTLKSSKIGNVFDHGIDLVHPPFWWWAWVVGVQSGLHPMSHADLILAVVIGGYIAQRLLEGIFLAAFKVEMHAWRPFDSFFRLITARRNPNLILLTLAVLAGRPDLGMIAVAVWTGLSFVVHLVQCLQAWAAPRGTVVSWLSR
jgi:phosphatidylglycerophosphate synthase